MCYWLSKIEPYSASNCVNPHITQNLTVIAWNCVVDTIGSLLSTTDTTTVLPDTLHREVPHGNPGPWDCECKSAVLQCWLSLSCLDAQAKSKRQKQPLRKVAEEDNHDSSMNVWVTRPDFFLAETNTPPSLQKQLAGRFSGTTVSTIPTQKVFTVKIAPQLYNILMKDEIQRIFL